MLHRTCSRTPAAPSKRSLLECSTSSPWYPPATCHIHQIHHVRYITSDHASISRQHITSDTSSRQIHHHVRYIITSDITPAYHVRYITSDTSSRRITTDSFAQDNVNRRMMGLCRARGKTHSLVHSCAKRTPFFRVSFDPSLSWQN